MQHYYYNAFQDISMTMLKKVLRQVEIIKSSRSGTPNFESLEVEVNDLQAAVAQYLQSRGAKVLIFQILYLIFPNGFTLFSLALSHFEGQLLFLS